MPVTHRVVRLLAVLVDDVAAQMLIEYDPQPRSTPGTPAGSARR